MGLLGFVVRFLFGFSVKLGTSLRTEVLTFKENNEQFQCQKSPNLPPINLPFISCDQISSKSEDFFPLPSEMKM